MKRYRFRVTISEVLPKGKKKTIREIQKTRKQYRIYDTKIIKKNIKVKDKRYSKGFRIEQKKIVKKITKGYVTEFNTGDRKYKNINFYTETKEKGTQLVRKEYNKLLKTKKIKAISSMGLLFHGKVKNYYTGSLRYGSESTKGNYIPTVTTKHEFLLKTLEDSLTKLEDKVSDIKERDFSPEFEMKKRKTKKQRQAERRRSKQHDKREREMEEELNKETRKTIKQIEEEQERLREMKGYL